jgi:hypothetical protein
MKTTLKWAPILVLAAPVLAAGPGAFAQDPGNMVYRTSQIGGGPALQASGAGTAVAWSAFDRGASTPVQGAPYSATITNELVQTLADGNRITQTSSGSTARDSQGRTRQETVLPPIGNLSAANAPRLVFIHDTVAQTSYTLNLTDKTAQKIPTFSSSTTGSMTGPGVMGGGVTSTFVRVDGGVTAGAAPLPPLPPPMIAQATLIANDQAEVSTEDLGSKTMEGIIVNGVRTTRTISAGEIGNEKPISIVTEVWTSPDLKTVVYSKRSDPRMGEQTFQLTNIARSEPDASLFTVPADFKIVDGPQRILYQPKQ